MIKDERDLKGDNVRIRVSAHEARRSIAEGTTAVIVRRCLEI